ncbi:MAG: glycosyltransferase [Planctomycetota bacterium]
MLTGLSLFALACAFLAAGMFAANLQLFRRLEISNADLASNPNEMVSVLIPARDEASSISASVGSILDDPSFDGEIIVLDDHSTDGTPGIVEHISASDSRVRLESAPSLVEGWNGKQHACFHAARLANFESLLFLDADVRLENGAIGRLLTDKTRSGVDLLSAFPRQETKTWLERWIIPLMHYILLCYLPLKRSRSDSSPSLAAGCGQLFLTTKTAYEAAGTHQAIASSRHDGVKLPRAFRSAGLRTDVVDGSSIATCRMYQNAAQVLRGVLKNATEGIASPKTIIPFSVLLLGGSVLPWLTVVLGVLEGSLWAVALSTFAIVLSCMPRFVAAKQLRQSLVGAIFHPPSVALFIALQWVALVQSLIGYQVQWRGRA